MNNSGIRKPTFGEVIILLVIFLAIVFSFTAYLNLPIQLGLFISWFLVMILGLRLGFQYQDLEKAIWQGIYDGMGAVLILVSVGALIGTWIAGGVVPSLIYYGLDIIHPRIFLLATLIICTITSLATGTSWGSAGTAGLAMMGIGHGLGFPLPVIAGAVLSGVYFGDKLSPLSDSTNLTASMSKVDVIDHVRSMMYVSVPAWVITAVAFTITGFFMGGGEADLTRVNNYMNALAENFTINIWMLIPAVVVVALLVAKKPALPSITFGALLGVVWAYLFQDMSLTEALNTAYAGFSIDSGVEFIDSLLNRGGIAGMLGSIAVILFGLGFGGLLEKIGALEVIVEKFAHIVTNTGRLSLGTVIVGLLSNAFGCAMYVSLIMTPKIMEKSYDELKVKRTVLSRNTEVGGTLTSGMVPWSDNGIFMAATLGVPVFQYLPFMWLSFASIIIAVIYGYTGFAMWTQESTGSEQIVKA